MDLRKRMLARLTPQARQWFEISNADDTGTVVVRIYDEIGYWGTTADDFARQVSAVTAERIEVQINSPGGDVFDGLAIYNTLRTHPAHITTRVDGLAASAASVIAQAGDHRVIVQAGQMMIHEAWGVAVGPASELREFADLLDRQSDVIAGIYAERSDGEIAAFRELMAAETWLTDSETVELGLADELLVPDRKTPPAASAAKPPAGGPPPAPETEAFDGSALLSQSKVREMFGSTALAD